MGFFDSVPGVEAGGVWNERRFRGIDLPHCAAMIHADAGPDQLNLSSDWLSWGTYGDDYYPLVFGASRNFAAAKHLNDRLPAFMPIDLGPTPPPASPIEKGLADLWRRTAEPMAVSSREQFRKAVEDMTFSWLWELANQIQHRIPDPIDYVEMRRKTFGSDLTMSLARLAHADIVPPEVYQNRVLHELDTAAQDYAAFANDLHSYQKEIEFEGELHNMVLVVQNFLDVDRWQAADLVRDLMTARMEQFEHIVANDLPALFDDLNLEDAARKALTQHADDLKDWMSGILEWHRKCVRYTEPELQRNRVPDLSFLPRGLGTSAVRVG
jgi:germacradienol/geosmin synthase